MGLATEDANTDAIVKLIQPKKPSFSLNMWNSKQTNHSIDYLAKQLQNNDTLITGLSFKFNYLPFEHLLKINDSLTYNKTLVRLDLSNNRL